MFCPECKVGEMKVDVIRDYPTKYNTKTISTETFEIEEDEDEQDCSCGIENKFYIYCEDDCGFEIDDDEAYDYVEKNFPSIYKMFEG
jgi:hypothetical protein